MEKFLAIVFIILVIAAFMGNIEMIAALIVQDTSPITENGFLVFVAVVADIILLCLLIKKLSKPTANSLSLAKRGITNRLNIKKQSAEIKKTSRNITDYINRLKELRTLGIERDSTIRTHKFCQLLVAVSNEEQMKACLEAVNRRKAIVNEISDIEQSIVQLADKYRTVGNAEKCVQYLEIVESVQNRNDFGEIKKECNEQLILQEKESKAIKLWTILAVLIILVALIIFSGSYIKDTPYRELRSMIEDQSLTAEMCDWDNRKDENSYYEYLHSEKGYKFLADVFTELHRNNEIEKALWLLCVQPDCIDGMDLCASDSFIDWVVNYAKQNGTKKEQSDGDITYYVNGYEISISSIFDYSIGHTFHISNGKESTSVEKRNPYHEGSVPTIR